MISRQLFLYSRHWLLTQVLRTYEGRRLHEKLQHVAKLNVQVPAAQEETEEGRDSKSILMDHLKAAGLDPSILDDSNMNAEEENGYDNGAMNDTNESFDNEDDEDDDDDEDEDDEATENPATSSSGLEEQTS